MRKKWRLYIIKSLSCGHRWTNLKRNIMLNWSLNVWFWLYFNTSSIKPEKWKTIMGLRNVFFFYLLRFVTRMFSITVLQLKICVGFLITYDRDYLTYKQIQFTFPRRCLTYTEIICISLCLFLAKPKAMVLTYPSHSTHIITTKEKNKYSAFPSLK